MANNFGARDYDQNLAGDNQDPDDFDFDETNTYNENQSMNAGRGMSPPRNTNMGLNPHMSGVGGGAESVRIQKEREDINLRGRVLQEQLMSKTGAVGGGADIAMSNQMRIGGNYMNIEDPNKPPYSPFYLMTTGHVQSGTFDDQDGICAQFDIVGGQDWQVHSVSFILNN